MIQKKIAFFLFVFLTLSLSRFIPHPPNFTVLLGLSFYIPIIFGFNYILVFLIAYVATDFIIGFHSLTIFTWGSIVLISILSHLFNKKKSYFRVCGSVVGAILFFIITNFGVWISGRYEYSFEGLILCYYLAIPFFQNTLFSTLITSLILELILKIKINNFKKSFFLKIKFLN